MIPEKVLAECRRKSWEAMREGKPANRTAAIIVVVIWLVLVAVAAFVTARVLREFALT
jgi:hypothetical protein